MSPCNIQVIRDFFFCFQHFQGIPSGVKPEIFQGKGGFVELEHFDKHFVKNTKKMPRREKFWSFFS